MVCPARSQAHGGVRSEDEFFLVFDLCSRRVSTVLTSWCDKGYGQLPGPDWRAVEVAEGVGMPSLHSEGGLWAVLERR